MTIRLLVSYQPTSEPTNQNERVRLLVDHLGFTHKEAVSYLNGDQQTLSTVTSRRKQVADDLLSHEVNANDGTQR